MEDAICYPCRDLRLRLRIKKKLTLRLRIKLVRDQKLLLSNQRGCLAYSLVELLIAVLLGNVVIVMVIQGYQLLQTTILKVEQRFTLAQKADIAKFYLRSDIQAAGYRGNRSCDGSLPDVNHAKVFQNLALQQQILVSKKILSGRAVADLPKKIADKIAAHGIKMQSDVVLIKDIPTTVYKVAATMQNKCDAIAVDHGENELNLHAGSLAAIADLHGVERFVASSVIHGKQVYRPFPENDDLCLQRKFDTTAEVITLQWIAYYLAKKNVTDTTYSLYRDDVLHAAEEVIDGVEDFYVRLLNENSLQELAKLPESADWPILSALPAQTFTSSQIVGAEVGILLRSTFKFANKQSIIWQGHTITYTDGYLRMPVLFKVALRNVC